jgi:CsoR family transcriptional regulator, copper-sensing transcriptional repressor
MNCNISKKPVSHRFKIAKGHLEKVIKMLDEEAYCIDVIHQSQAVQQALKKADEALLECHLNCCVVDGIKNGNTKKVIDEVMTVVKKGR